MWVGRLGNNKFEPTRPVTLIGAPTHARSARQRLHTGLLGRTKFGFVDCWLPLLDDLRNWMMGEECRELALAA